MYYPIEPETVLRCEQLLQEIELHEARERLATVGEVEAKLSPGAGDLVYPPLIVWSLCTEPDGRERWVWDSGPFYSRTAAFGAEWDCRQRCPRHSMRYQVGTERQMDERNAQLAELHTVWLAENEPDPEPVILTHAQMLAELGLESSLTRPSHPQLCLDLAA